MPNYEANSRDNHISALGVSARAGQGLHVPRSGTPSRDTQLMLLIRMSWPLCSCSHTGLCNTDSGTRLAPTSSPQLPSLSEILGTPRRAVHVQLYDTWALLNRYGQWRLYESRQLPLMCGKPGLYQEEAPPETVPCQQALEIRHNEHFGPAGKYNMRESANRSHKGLVYETNSGNRVIRNHCTPRLVSLFHQWVLSYGIPASAFKHKGP